MDRVPRDRGGIEPPGRLARVPTAIGLLQYRSAKVVTHKAGFSPAPSWAFAPKETTCHFSFFFFFCLNLEYDPESF
jgi:hypothetical protein